MSVTLPEPTIDEPHLDIRKSSVAFHDEGWISKFFRNSDVEKKAQIKALDKMTKAARDEDALTERAKKNTTAMLTGLIRALGYNDVRVNYGK